MAEKLLDEISRKLERMEADWAAAREAAREKQDRAFHRFNEALAAIAAQLVDQSDVVDADIVSQVDKLVELEAIDGSKVDEAIAHSVAHKVLDEMPEPVTDLKTVQVSDLSDASTLLAVNKEFTGLMKDLEELSVQDGLSFDPGGKFRVDLAWNFNVSGDDDVWTVERPIVDDVLMMGEQLAQMETIDGSNVEKEVVDSVAHHMPDEMPKLIFSFNAISDTPILPGAPFIGVVMSEFGQKFIFDSKPVVTDCYAENFACSASITMWVAHDKVGSVMFDLQGTLLGLFVCSYFGFQQLVYGSGIMQEEKWKGFILGGSLISHKSELVADYFDLKSTDLDKSNDLRFIHEEINLVVANSLSNLLVSLIGGHDDLTDFVNSVNDYGRMMNGSVESLIFYPGGVGLTFAHHGNCLSYRSVFPPMPIGAELFNDSSSHMFGAVIDDGSVSACHAYLVGGPFLVTPRKFTHVKEEAAGIKLNKARAMKPSVMCLDCSSKYVTKLAPFARNIQVAMLEEFSITANEFIAQLMAKIKPHFVAADLVEIVASIMLNRLQNIIDACIIVAPFDPGGNKLTSSDHTRCLFNGSEFVLATRQTHLRVNKIETRNQQTVLACGSYCMIGPFLRKLRKYPPLRVIAGVNLEPRIYIVASARSEDESSETKDVVSIQLSFHEQQLFDKEDAVETELIPFDPIMCLGSSSRARLIPFDPGGKMQSSKSLKYGNDGESLASYTSFKLLFFYPSVTNREECKRGAEIDIMFYKCVTYEFPPEFVGVDKDLKEKLKLMTYNKEAKMNMQHNINIGGITFYSLRPEKINAEGKMPGTCQLLTFTATGSIGQLWASMTNVNYKFKAAERAADFWADSKASAVYYPLQALIFCFISCYWYVWRATQILPWTGTVLDDP